MQNQRNGLKASIVTFCLSVLFLTTVYAKNIFQLSSSLKEPKSFAKSLDSLIVNGDNATGSRNFYVSMRIGGVYYIRCGGSIISSYWLITAAHCINRFPRTIIFVIIVFFRKH